MGAEGAAKGTDRFAVAVLEGASVFATCSGTLEAGLGGGEIAEGATGTVIRGVDFAKVGGPAETAPVPNVRAGGVVFETGA